VANATLMSVGSVRVIQMLTLFIRFAGIIITIDILPVRLCFF
jgi:hypothetical protein